MVQSTRLFATRLLVLGLTGAGIACQGSDLTLPGDGLQFSLRAAFGDGEEGTVGTQLPDPVVVQVTDGGGQPVPNVAIRFDPKSPGAQVEPNLDPTNDSGYAEARVRLGPTEGFQVVEASLADGESDVKVSFVLTAIAPPPEEGEDEDRDRGRGGGGGHGGGHGGGGHDDDDDDD